MILQWCSTIKVSIELSVATRYRRDMTEKLLKATLSPKKRQHLSFSLFHLIITSQSLNLGGRRGTTDDVATIPFYPSLSSAALRESPNPIPIHSLMLSSHLFFCLPLLLAPFTVPCRTVFSMPEDLEMWPLSFHFFTMVRRSSCTPLHSGFCYKPPHSSHGLCRKCSEVSYSISSQGLGSFSLFLLSRSSSHRHKGR